MGGSTNGNIMDHFWNPPSLVSYLGVSINGSAPDDSGVPPFREPPHLEYPPTMAILCYFDRKHDEPVDLGVPQFSDKPFPPPPQKWVDFDVSAFLHVERNFQLYGIYVYIIIFNLEYLYLIGDSKLFKAISFAWGMLLVMVTCLVCFHSYLALANITTWESISWYNISYLKSLSPEDGSPFSQSIRMNLAIYCCSDCCKVFQTEDGWLLWELGEQHNPLECQCCGSCALDVE